MDVPDKRVTQDVCIAASIPPSTSGGLRTKPLSQMTKLLVIGYVWPEPSSSAAGAHMLSLLELFNTQGWQITFASPAQRTEHMADLDSLGIQCADIELNSSCFDQFVEQLRPQIVLFDRFMMEEQFGWRVEKACPGALRILDTEDLFCLRHARHDALKKHGRINPALTRSFLFTELAQREIAAILRCDLSLVISDAEMHLLTDLFGVAPNLLQYYPFIIDPEQLNDPTPTFEQRQGFISIGNFRHPPNWDAVRWLKERIWPLIRRDLPQAECYIYGAYTPPKATALHNPKQGFYVQGWAPSVATVMQQARVNLAPLRFGAGLKGKLADAMICGTPSVTTSIGAEGMHGDLPFAGAIADSAEEIAHQAVSLYRDHSGWQQAQRQGFAIIQQRFDKKLHNDELLRTIQRLRENLDEHRLNNFTGAMLRYHLHKSTQYMSQWIEAKNQTSSPN